MARRKSTSVNPQDVFDYLTGQKGVSEFHAKGMIANIKNESSFRPEVIGDQGTSGGFFQHHNERFSALKRHTPDWKTNWKGQVDYALTEPDTQRYLGKSFRDPREASMWFTEKWERPADARNKARQRAKDVNLAGYQFGSLEDLGFSLAPTDGSPVPSASAPTVDSTLALPTPGVVPEMTPEVIPEAVPGAPASDDDFFEELGFSVVPPQQPEPQQEMAPSPGMSGGMDLGAQANMYAQATAPGAIQPTDVIEEKLSPEAQKYEQIGEEFAEHRQNIPALTRFEPPGKYGAKLAQEELKQEPVEVKKELETGYESYGDNLGMDDNFEDYNIRLRNEKREREAKGERSLFGKTVGDVMSVTDAAWQGLMSAVGINLGKDTPTFTAKMGKAVDDARKQTLATAREENPGAVEQIKIVYDAIKENPKETIKELGVGMVDHLPSMLVTRKISLGALKKLGKLSKAGKAQPTKARELLSKEKFAKRLKREATIGIPSDIASGKGIVESGGGKYGLGNALTDAVTGAVVSLPIAGLGHLTSGKVRKIKGLEHLEGFKKLTKEQFDKIEKLVITKGMEKNPKVLEMIPQFLDMADSPHIRSKIIGFDDSTPTKFWNKKELKKAGYGDREPGWYTSAGKTDKDGVTLFKKADASTVMEEITHHLQDVVRKDFPEIQSQIKAWEGSVRKLAKKEGRKLPDGDELFAKVFSSKMGHADKFPENITTIPMSQKLVDSFGSLLKKEGFVDTPMVKPPKAKIGKKQVSEPDVPVAHLDEPKIKPVKKESRWTLDEDETPELPPRDKPEAEVKTPKQPKIEEAPIKPPKIEAEIPPRVKKTTKKEPAPKSVLEEGGESYKYENLDKAYPDGPTKKQIIQHLFEKEGKRVSREEAGKIRKHLEDSRKLEGDVRYQLKPVDDSPIDLPAEYKTHGEKKLSAKDVAEKVGGGSEKFKQFMEDIAVPLSTKIGKRSEKIIGHLRKYDFDNRQVSKEFIEPMLPLLQKMEKLPNMDKRRLDFALKNGNTKVRDAYLKKYGLEDDFKAANEAKAMVKEEAEAMGIEVGNIENYWPRQVADVDGLLKYLNNNVPQSKLLRALKQKAKDLDRALTSEEKIDLANQYVQGINPKGVSKPGSLKQRTIETITPEMDKFYKTSIESMTDYVDTMTRYMAQRKFFGKNVLKDADGMRIDTESSIGAYLLEEIESGRLKAGDEVELTNALRAYFKPGQMNKTLSKFKTLGYLSTLGSVFNTITQFTDLPYSIRKNGIKSFAQTAFAKKKWKLEDINVEHIAEELAGADRLSKLTNRVFKINMFKMVDRWSKETFTNSAMKTAQRQAKNNDTKLNNKLEFMFGKRAGKVKQDIIDGTVNKDTSFYAFNELSGVQPISLLEVPQKYLTSGNGRIMYMLKTFAIKQFDVLRQDMITNVVKEAQAGNKVQAAKNFAKISGFVGSLVAAGMTKDAVTDMMRGKEFDMDDAVLDNVLKLLFVSKYAARTFREDGIGQGLAGLTLPPFKTMDAMVKDIYKMTQGKFEAKDAQTIESIPVIGEIFSSHFGRKKERRDKKRRKALGL